MENQKRINDKNKAFEQHLRSLRPRAPLVDAAEVQAVASTAGLKAASIKTGNDSFFVSRFWFTVAASWLCGTLIGAGAMYFSLEKSRRVVASGDDAPQTVEVSPQEASAPVTDKQDDKTVNNALANQSSENLPAPKTTPPDLIGFAQQTSVLRAGVNLVTSEAVGGPSSQFGDTSRSAKNTPIDADSYETVSKVMREIQLPANSVSTRASLIKDLLEIY